MHWRNALAAGVLAALSLHAQDFARLPAPPVPKDTLRVDSAKTHAENDSTTDTVSYSALRIRFQSDRFSLADKALLKYEGSTLTADSIVYYSGDDIVEAFGAPLIEDPTQPPILGYRMRYNLKNHVGTVYYGSSKRQSQNFHGTEIRRQADGDVYISRAEFSTCDKADPDYFFYARRMIVEPEVQVLSGPIVMDIADVPVAVLPMMVIPLGNGRRSGLLQPKFGGDQAQGYYLTNMGYYWALNDYTDFLLAGDLVEGQSGTFDNTNLNATYEWNKLYVWNGMLDGKVYVSQFNPSTAGGYLDFRNDLNLTPDGRQTLKGSGRLQSNPTVVADNALTVDEALQQTANADLGYRRQFDWNQAVLNVDLNQNYNLTENQVNRSLPDITFQVGGPLIPAPEDETPGLMEPWYRNLNWNYGNRFNVDQVSDPALNGVRGDTNIYAGYSDNLSLSGKYSSGYINLTPSVNLSQLWSASKTTGDTARPYRSAFNPEQNETGEYFFGWNTGVSADTRFYGIAQAGDHPWFGRLLAIRHTVTPSISLTYAPKLDSNTRFYPDPLIGGTAFQPEQRTVGFQLGNDIDLKLADPDSPKKKPDPYKLFSATSALSYNFANHVQPWSDMTSTLNLYLTRDIALTVNATHGLYDNLAADSAQQNELTSPFLKSWEFAWRKGIEVGGGFSSGLRVLDAQGLATDHFKQSPWSASLNYGFDISGTRVGTTGGNAAERFFGTSEIFNVQQTNQATGSLKINPTPGWQMSYNTEFNFEEGRFSSQTFGFVRVLHCWQMEFNWIPVGVGEGWNFNIHIIDLPDVKLQSNSTHGLQGEQ